MTGWLVRSIGALVIFSSVGAVGGGINYLTTKKVEQKEVIQVVSESQENPPEEKRIQEIIERNSQARKAKGKFCQRVDRIYGRSGNDEKKCEQTLRRNGYIRQSERSS